jgi:hypothetical protein
VLPTVLCVQRELTQIVMPVIERVTVFKDITDSIDLVRVKHVTLHLLDWNVWTTTQPSREAIGGNGLS